MLARGTEGLGGFAAGTGTIAAGAGPLETDERQAQPAPSRPPSAATITAASQRLRGAGAWRAPTMLGWRSRGASKRRVGSLSELKARQPDSTSLPWPALSP